MVAGICGGIAVLAAGVAGLVYLTRPFRRMSETVGDFLDDWNGEPARRGVPERPGVMVRLERIEGRLSTVETQMSRNGGRSLRDRIEAVATATGAEPEPD